MGKTVPAKGVRALQAMARTIPEEVVRSTYPVLTDPPSGSLASVLP